MSKILELRSKRAALWEQTKKFLEEHRGENGLVASDAVEQYNKMAGEGKALGNEISRLEEQEAFEAQLKAPTTTPVTGKPKADVKPTSTKATATPEYSEAFWNMIRLRGDYGAIQNALSIGVDSEGGYTVPDEFVRPDRAMLAVA
ncbi:MAG: phage major capsid protein [Lachnospiraceae bacterium]|nr:phage major capsid protein [Lachnospiraceae bacterium]